MRILTSFSIIILSSIFLFSCKIEPREINYGKDHCDHCDMTVVDKTHAAEYVTKKGKSYMFDAIECMIWQLGKKKNEDKMAYLLVADYSNPGELIDARKATFLVSKKIKSPMGAFLSAFSSKEVAQKTQKEHGGNLYTWKEIKKVKL